MSNIIRKLAAGAFLLAGLNGCAVQTAADGNAVASTADTKAVLADALARWKAGDESAGYVAAYVLNSPSLSGEQLRMLRAMLDSAQ